MHAHTCSVLVVCCARAGLARFTFGWGKLATEIKGMRRPTLGGCTDQVGNRGRQARVSHSVPTEPPRRQAPDMFGTGTERLYAVAPSLSSCDGDCSSRVSPVRGCTRRLLMALAGITSSRWECATAVPASGHTTSAPAKTHSADSCMPNLHIARRSLCGSLSRVE